MSDDTIDKHEVKDFLYNNWSVTQSGFFDESLTYGGYAKIPEELDVDIFENLTMDKMSAIEFFLNNLDDISVEELENIIRTKFPNKVI